MPSKPKVDIQVRLGLRPFGISTAKGNQKLWHVSDYNDEHGFPMLKVWTLAGGSHFRFRYCDDTEFIIDRAGTQVWAYWPASLTLEDTVTYFLGPVMGFLLRLRGIVCLHASAVAIGDKALALLGPAGAGKSTTAAAFADLGFPVLSEDIVALSDSADLFLVQPGYPRIRLWPSSVRALYGSSDALPLLTPTWDKLYLDLTEKGYRFQQEPLPFSAIYILNARSSHPEAPFIATESAHSGMITLVANTYTNYLLDKTMRRKEFEVLSRLVAQGPLRRVTPHADISRLPELCNAILDDFQSISASIGVG